MSLVIKEGNYLSMGTTITKNQVSFTFECEKEDPCRIVLISKSTQEKEYISVPKEYCVGSIRSLTVSGINPQEYNYLYEINGKEQLDPYARVVVGREKWNDSARKNKKHKLLGGFDTNAISWGEDKSPEIPKSMMVMYKLHVRGFSMASKATDKCIYQDDMYACNLYEFTITNNSDVTQELIFTLDVKENGFGNLYYNLLESSINEITTDSKYKKTKIYIDGIGEKEMLNNIVLGPKDHKTYTIIYYVKNLSNVDQTSMDADKKFYANVRVDSITT